MASASRLRFEQIDIRSNPDKAHDIWRRLCAGQDHSYYISPGWMQTWCECLPSPWRPQLMLGHRDDGPCCAFVMTQSNRLRQGFFPSNSVHIYSTGDFNIDFIEGIYNHFLSIPTEKISLQEFIESIPFNWDEIIFPGFDIFRFPGLEFLSFPQKLRITDYMKQTYFVDLHSIGNDIDSYFSLLSSNTRSQIKRSYKLYETSGNVRITQASTLEEAFDMLHNLYRLFSIRHSRIQKIPRDTSFFKQFHERLIRTRFHTGEIQLLKIHTDETVLGYLYNHTYNNVVHYYQCGFNYPSDNKARPGLVAHSAAIMHNKQLGFHVYDFGPGDTRYKRSLSTGNSPVAWVRLLRASSKMKIFRWLKELKERLRPKS
jgi:hypothetical protein